jgi:hypothetical protein
MQPHETAVAKSGRAVVEEGMKPIQFSIFLWLLFVSLPAFLTEAGAVEGRLLSALRPDEALVLCGETAPMEASRIKERFEKEMLVALGNRPQVILWLKRSTRYFPYIERVLAENGLPDDLKYLAVAESALRMHAGSSKGAMGVWQMMPQTARKYGLEVSSRFDERRNIYLATPAAIAYLKDLYTRFDSWTLALAAYNMGEEGLEAEILEQGVDDYFRLYLSIETQRFIFRILAIKQIMGAPDQFGFDLAPDDYYAPETFSTVVVTSVGDLPLRLVARAAETDFTVIKELNPEIRGHYLAKGIRPVNIPEGGEKGFPKRLARLVEEEAGNMEKRIYVVKAGDNLSIIAEKFEVPLASLLIWNRIDKSRVIHPGQELVIAPPAKKD